MGRARRKAPGGSARERILRAAARLYAMRGFEGTSLREVAEAARVTKPLVLYHFESKERLYATLLREAVGSCRSESQRILERQASAGERLRELLRWQAEQTSEAPEIAAFAYEVMTMPGLLPLGFDYRSEGRELFEVYVRLIEEGRRSGEFRAVNPRTVAVLSVASLGLYAAAVLTGELERIPDDLGDSLFDLLMQGVEARRS
jgi:AcrR family transcriptional regulator